MSVETAVPGPAGRPILFFDGMCGICDGFVQFVIQRDTEARFRFAPLQGEAAARRGLALEDWREASIVLEVDGARWEASDAVLRVFVMLGGGYGALARMALWIPHGIREFGYHLVARRRYRWFGRMNACRIPTAAERERFLE